MQAASLGRFFLVDALRFAYAANRAPKPNPDVERHHLESWRPSDDEYTSDESHCCTLAVPRREWLCELFAHLRGL